MAAGVSFPAEMAFPGGLLDPFEGRGGSGLARQVDGRVRVDPPVLTALEGGITLFVNKNGPDFMKLPN